MKVLVVDDEQLVRWFLERAMKKWGHSVVSVSNAADALREIEKSQFDIVFTDLRMPDGNGTSLVKRVRGLPDRNPRIVVCSAFITAEMAQDFKKKGILMLKKPFKLVELENTIKLCEK